MNIIFMGSPDFAVVSLKRLRAAKLPVVAVVTQPDRPRGRGRRTQPTPVALYAEEAGLPLLKPQRLRNREIRQQLLAFEPDLFVVVAYRILPPGILSLPRRGSINLHGSLLPEYRGAAPIQHALIDGERMTGLTTFQLDEQVDTGGILLQRELPIQPEDDFGTLHDRMADLGAELLIETIDGYLTRELEPRSQPPGEYRGAPRITALDRLLRWEQDAKALHNRIRGLSPLPGACCRLDGKQVRVFATSVIAADTPQPPGTVLQAGRQGILVACGADALLITDLQLEGKKRLPAADFLNGHPLHAGDYFANGIISTEQQ